MHLATHTIHSEETNEKKKNTKKKKKKIPRREYENKKKKSKRHTTFQNTYLNRFKLTTQTTNWNEIAKTQAKSRNVAFCWSHSCSLLLVQYKTIYARICELFKRGKRGWFTEVALFACCRPLKNTEDTKSRLSGYNRRVKNENKTRDRSCTHITKKKREKGRQTHNDSYIKF